MTILHDYLQVILRSLLLLWSSCHASQSSSHSWKLQCLNTLNQVFPWWTPKNTLFLFYQCPSHLPARLQKYNVFKDKSQRQLQQTIFHLGVLCTGSGVRFKPCNQRFHVYSFYNIQHHLAEGNPQKDRTRPELTQLFSTQVVNTHPPWQFSFYSPTYTKQAGTTESLHCG